MTDRFTHDWSAKDVHPPHVSAHTSAQEAHSFLHEDAQIEAVEAEIIEGAPYSGHQLTDELAVAESTFRTRWMSWLERVAPIELLKTDEGYTELARSLALEFKQVPSRKAARERWVSEAKHRYSGEFSPDGLIAEGLPGDLGSTLALVRQQGSQIQSAADAQLAQLQALITEQVQVEAEFDAAEIEAIRARGMKRGVQRFQIEAEAEDDAYYQLRKLRSQGQAGGLSQNRSGGGRS